MQSRAIVTTPFGPIEVSRRSSAPFGIRDFFENPSMVLSQFGDFKVDVKETDDAYDVSAELPGYDKQDINITIEDDVLTISCEHKEEDKAEDENGKWIHHERSFSSMKRSFYLPNADEDATKATLEDGVLSLTIPKAKEPEPETKKIEIS